MTELLPGGYNADMAPKMQQEALFTMDYHALAQELIQTLTYRKLPTEGTRQLGSGERGILNYLHYTRDGVMAGELSRELGITTGRTAIALKNLESKGLVRHIWPLGPVEQAANLIDRAVHRHRLSRRAPAEAGQPCQGLPHRTAPPQLPALVPYRVITQFHTQHPFLQ